MVKKTCNRLLLLAKQVKPLTDLLGDILHTLSATPGTQQQQLLQMAYTCSALSQLYRWPGAEGYSRGHILSLPPKILRIPSVCFL